MTAHWDYLGCLNTPTYPKTQTHTDGWVITLAVVI